MGRSAQDLGPSVGSNPAITGLVMELVRRGNVVTVYTLSNNLRHEVFYDWGNLRVFVGRDRRFRHLYRQQIAYLKRTISADAPRFVHAQWTSEYALGPLAAGVPTITTIHDLPWKVLWYVPHPSVFARVLLAYMVGFKGKYFTAVSAEAVRHFRRFLFSRAPIEVIPNFIGDWIFELGRTRVAVRDRPFTFLTILQGWSRRKNPKCALKAFGLVRKSLPNARLIMIGKDYEAGGPAERWAVSKGLDQGVIFRGRIPGYGDLLRFVMEETDVFVHPSLDEALSLTTTESMALKKPVIAGERTPGMRRLLDDGRVGLLVNVRSAEAVARAMEKLAGDPELCKTMAEAAYAYAWDNFRADVVVPQYEDLYRRFDALAVEKANQLNQEVQNL